MSALTPERLDEIRERADAATEGPWVHGDRWHIQAASHCHCALHGHLVHEGRMDINGQMMQAHVHEREERWWPHGIYAPPSESTGHHPVNVVNDTDEYGYMDDADASFIAHARADVPALLAEVERLRSIITGQIDAACREWLEEGDTDALARAEHWRNLLDPTEGETDADA